MKINKAYNDSSKRYDYDLFIKIHITPNWINDHHYVLPYGCKIWEVVLQKKVEQACKESFRQSHTRSLSE